MTSSDTDPGRAGRAHFVQADGGRLTLAGRPYCFAGVNLWYGAYLGADAEHGDRDRLRGELDELARLGLRNLRVMGSAEASPMLNAVSPAFRGRGRDFNETLLCGLDFLLAEMAARDLRAVVCLTNFWEWSGGMGTYLYWTNGGHFVDMGDPAHPWPAFVHATMLFYGSAAANALYQDYVRALVTRTNTVTGIAYRDDPTIMAWQLANEPRAGSSLEPGHHAVPEFTRWVAATAGLIKELAPRQLVSSGSEGLVGCVSDEACFVAAHGIAPIDYLTAHIWPKNWGWLADGDMRGTYDRAEELTAAYLDQHLALAERLGKPLVLEEFGLPRDDGALTPGSPTSYRDRYYAFLLGSVAASASAGGPLVGANVWTWGGRGRAHHADGRWRAGDTCYTGDPPQEPQGLNSIFDVDASTLRVLEVHAAALAQQPAGASCAAHPSKGGARLPSAPQSPGLPGDPLA